MNRTRPRLKCVGALVGCAVAVTAWQFAWAGNNPPVPTLLSGPVIYGPLNFKAELDDYELELKTSGNSTGRTVHFVFAPGASTGWHLHPGPAFVMVTAGTVSLYRDPNSPDGVFGAGQGWVEPPGQVHMAVNEGTEDAELVAFLLIPEGQPPTIPQPPPGQ